MVYKPTVLAAKKKTQQHTILQLTFHVFVSFRFVWWCLICLCLFISTNARVLQFCIIARRDVIYVFEWRGPRSLESYARFDILASRLSSISFRRQSNMFRYVNYGDTFQGGEGKGDDDDVH